MSTTRLPPKARRRGLLIEAELQELIAEERARQPARDAAEYRP